MAPKQALYVIYARVSTQRQGRSGLGLDAQREAARQYVVGRGGRVIAPEYVEIESGKRADRPELAKAISRCRKTGATLLVAKLDRLSRDVAFLMTLKNSGVDLAAADMPEANTLMFTVMAGLAQHEREVISARTRAALMAAKARGTKLGGYREGAADITDYQALGVEAVQGKAREDAELVRDDIEPMVKAGMSLRGIASALNEAGILSPRRKTWSPQGVSNVIERLGLRA